MFWLVVKEKKNGFAYTAFFLDCSEDLDTHLVIKLVYGSGALVHYLLGQPIYMTEDLSQLPCFIGESVKVSHLSFQWFQEIEELRNVSVHIGALQRKRGALIASKEILQDGVL